MSTGIISIGISGIRAAQLGLMTAEHNITNASVPGYSRQRTIQTTSIPVATGAGFVGQGTTVRAIERMYSQTLVNQVNTAQSKVSELEAYFTQIKQIDNMLADANAGLSPALQDYFTGVQDLVANPSMMAARQSMISSAQALVSRFQGIEGRLAELHEGVGNDIVTTVASINSYSQQLAELNQRIVIAQAATLAPANDLLDQRDHLMTELNKLVEVRSTTNSDGTFNVFFGTGQQLVVGPNVTTLTAQAAYADITRIVVGIQTAGAVQELPESLITGGKLAGLLNFRSETLDRAANEVGRLAATLAMTTNAQHALGQDLLGQIAGEGSFVADFFTLNGPRVSANSLNTSGAELTASFVSPSIGGSYALTHDGANYTLTRSTDGRQWSAATLAGLQSSLPASEGLDVSGAVLGTDIEGDAGESFRLTFDGTNYTLARTPAGTAGAPFGDGPWVAANRAALQALVTAAAPAGINPAQNIDVTDLAATGLDSTALASSAAATANFFTNLSGSDYRYAYDGANYTVTRLSDGVSWSDNDPAELSDTIAASEGFRLNLSGSMLAGESFTVMPTRYAARGLGVNATIAADPRLIAVAMPLRTDEGVTNSGTATISAGVTRSGFSQESLPAGGLTLSYATPTPPQTLGTMSFSGTLPAGANVSVTVGTTTTVYPAGTPFDYDPQTGATITVAGLSFTLSGTPANGDTFTVGRNTSGVADSRNALAFGQLQTQGTVAGGSANLQVAYARLVSDAGNKTREIQVTAEAQIALLKQAEGAREALSGVNLDEEAANLMRYQQAYQASAKAVEIGNRLFDVILSLRA